MKQTIYLETTVPSYYVSRASRDVIALAHQEITRVWWETRLPLFDVYVSPVVLQEAAHGDSDQANKRLEVLSEFSVLEATTEVEQLAAIYMEQIGLPSKAIRDAAIDDKTIQRIRDGVALSEKEEQDLVNRLNTPEMYFNEDNLRRAYRKPGGTLINFIKEALGSFKLKSREEEMTENFQAWLVTKNLSPEQAQYLAMLKNRGIVRGEIYVNDLFQPPLSVLNAAGLGVELFGESGLKEIISDMNESIFSQKLA